MDNKIVVKQSFPLAGLLTLLFVYLKLTGSIAWSWWWVLSPLWLPYAIIFGFIVACALFVGLCGIIVAAIDSHDKNKKRRR